MNAERLHALVIALSHELSSANTARKLQELVNNLQNTINQPQQPAHQQGLSKSIKAINDELTDAHSDSFSPGWRQILQEIGGEQYFGNSLSAQINKIFAQNQITPSVALTELQELNNGLQAFKNALDQAASAFKHFDISYEKLGPGKCEIGILIPRAAVDNNLIDFAKELEDLGFILNTLSEVVTGKKDALAINTISSSDLLVYLHANLPYAACVAVCVERIVALYKQLLEIRKLHNDLHKQGVPQTQTAGIEQYANELMEQGIEKIIQEIVSKYHKKGDKGRNNELTNALRISLNKIANRIDIGFNIEVRVEPPAASKADNESQVAIDAIQSATHGMQYMKLEGKPILKLPESTAKPRKKPDTSGAEPNPQ